jgi:hypothetical protein
VVDEKQQLTAEKQNIVEQEVADLRVSLRGARDAAELAHKKELNKVQKKSNATQKELTDLKRAQKAAASTEKKKGSLPSSFNFSLTPLPSHII